MIAVGNIGSRVYIEVKDGEHTCRAGLTVGEAYRLHCWLSVPSGELRLATVGRGSADAWVALVASFGVPLIMVSYVCGDLVIVPVSEPETLRAALRVALRNALGGEPADNAEART